MPAGDRTGPVGNGPKTGRAMGLCNDFETPGYMNQPNTNFGRGRGGQGFGAGQGFGGNRPRGRGRFWGLGRFFGQNRLVNQAQPNGTEQNLQSLKDQAEQLQNSLSQINETIAKLEKE